MRNKILEDKNYRLWWLAHQTIDLMSKVRNRELSKYGFTSDQAAVLFVIKAINATKGKTTPGVISRWLPREPHSVSRILMRMEKAGLVSRTMGSDKRNEVIISITEKGEQAYRQSAKRKSIQDIMSCLSEEESQQLRSLLEKIRDKTFQKLTVKSKISFP